MRCTTVIAAFPDAYLEDPHDLPEIAERLGDHLERVSYDSPIRSAEDIGATPLAARVVNVKPSRIGSLRALFEVYARCAGAAADVRRRYGRAGRGPRAGRAARRSSTPTRPTTLHRAPTTRTTRRAACRPARWRRAPRRPAPLDGVDAVEPERTTFACAISSVGSSHGSERAWTLGVGFGRRPPVGVKADERRHAGGLVLRVASVTVGAVSVGGESTDVFPESYHQMLCPPVAEPPFEDPAELERVWGERWGSVDEVGTLRSVLLRRPGRELERIRADGWNPAARALVDPNGGWYWESEEPPDLPWSRSSMRAS